MRYSQQDRIDNFQVFGSLVFTFPILSTIMSFVKVKIIYWSYKVPIFVFLDPIELTFDFLDNFSFSIVGSIIALTLYLRVLKVPSNTYKRGFVILYSVFIICVISSLGLAYFLGVKDIKYFFATIIGVFILINLIFLGRYVFYYIRRVSPIKYKSIFSFYGITCFFVFFGQFYFDPDYAINSDYKYFGGELITATDTVKIDSTISILALTRNFYILRDLKNEKIRIIPKEEVKSFYISE